MRYLRTLSYVITMLGITLLVVSVAADLGATPTLIGMMLFVAGAVKITMVALWCGVARFDAAPEFDDR